MFRFLVRFQWIFFLVFASGDDSKNDTKLSELGGGISSFGSTTGFECLGFFLPQVREVAPWIHVVVELGLRARLPGFKFELHPIETWYWAS